MPHDNILVIGACGQIGAELVPVLRQLYGDNHVVAADLRPAPKDQMAAGPYVQLDVLNYGALSTLISRYDINQVYLLAAMLSANGEREPQRAWDLNMQSLLNILNLARERKLAKIFWPSSIAVFGPDAPKKNCPQNANLLPTTAYGISKAAGEHWSNYYWKKYNVDTRSLRFPGLISHKTLPGGGTTDYAVDIFHHAVASKKYACFLPPDSRLPMMYMPDAIRATLRLMEAPAREISVRTSYNLAAMSFTPAELAREIERYIPEFRMSYAPDFRQEIAASWPDSIDDSPARHDWKWDHEYELKEMTGDMLMHLARAKGVPIEEILELLPGGFC